VNQRSFNEISPNIVSAMNDGTDVWGGAFWELRQALGREVVDKLLFDAWFKLHAEDVLHDRGASFVKLLLAADKPHASRIQEIFNRRRLAV
jgi:hypothetical protein